MTNHLSGYFLDDDDESDEGCDTTILVLLAFLAADYTPRRRCHVRDRLGWDAHVNELHLESEASFVQMYRMNEASFSKLCALIEPFVRVDQEMLRRHTGKLSIGPEIILHCLLRWLAGGVPH